MNKLFALGTMALSFALGAPAMAQMDNHPMQHPGATTVTRTVDRPDGSRTVVRHENMRGDRDGDRQVVRRTVVRRTVVRHENTGWHRHHRHCATRWHHGQRVTRCWRR